MAGQFSPNKTQQTQVGARIIVLHVADLGPVMMTTACGNYDSPTYTEARRGADVGKQMQAFLKRIDFDGVRVDRPSAVAGYRPTAIYEAAEKGRRRSGYHPRRTAGLVCAARFLAVLLKATVRSLPTARW